MASSEAWVTLATSDTYALGALVLGQSLRRVRTTRKLHCLITPGVTQGMRQHLNGVFDAVSVVDVMDSGDEENLTLIQRPELGVTFTKLHCWRLTQYTKCVFLDADTLLLQNSDELFEHEEFSAAPDIGWPDIFNTGVYVFKPSLDTYRALLRTAATQGSFDGGDQGLLNNYFSDWRVKDAKFRLSFVYNMSSNAIYTYAAAYKRFSKDIKIVHFLGSIKPWHHHQTAGSLQYRSDSQHLLTHVQLWWLIFTEDIQPRIDPQYLPSSGSLQGAGAKTSRHIEFDSVVLEHQLTDVDDSLVQTSTELISGNGLRARQRRGSSSTTVSSVFSGVRVVKAGGGGFRSATYDNMTTPSPTSSADRPPPDGRAVAKSPFCRGGQPQPVRHVKVINLAAEPDVPSSVKYGLETRHEKTGGLRVGRPASAETLIEPERLVVTRDLATETASTTFGELRRAVGSRLMSESRDQENAQPHRVPFARPRGRLLVHQQVQVTPAGIANGMANSNAAPAKLPKSVINLDSPSYPNNESSLAGAGQPSASATPVPLSSPMDEVEHQRAWEAGHVDYMGKDSWENIQKRLDQSLGIAK